MHRSNMRFWVTSFAILAELLLIVPALPSLGGSSLPQQNNVCNTPTCEATASRIKSSMNLKVDPCDDFYNFTCGNYMEDASEMDKAGMNTDDRQILLQFQSLLETDNEIDDIEPIKQARILYKSCVNEELLKRTEPLIQIIKKFGGWPLVEGAAWNEANFDWMNFIADVNRAGLELNSILNSDMKEDSLNSSLRVITLDTPNLYDWQAFHRDSNGNKLRAYSNLVLDIAKNLGADQKTAEKEIKDAFSFQMGMDKITPGFTGIEGPRMTLKELIKRYPSVDWKTFFVKMYSPMQTITDNDVVIIQNLNFIDKVITLISNTPKRVQANFAMIQTIRRVLSIVDPKLDDIFHGTITDNSVYPPKSELCVKLVEDKLLPILAVMYLKKIPFTSEMKKYAEYMLQSIKDEFRVNLDEVAFLDEVTRMYAKEKERTIKHIFRYPEENLDNDNLNEYYRDLKFVDDEFVANSMKLRKFLYEKKIAGLPETSQSINRYRMRQILTSPTAFNDYGSNSVVLPANVFQKNAFDLERPHYMNFGTIGVIMSRVLTLMFSDRGWYYGVNGSLNNWRTNATLMAFLDKFDCFVNHYKKNVLDYTGRDVHRGTFYPVYLQANGALDIAYRAYVNAMGGKQEKQLPGLNYSSNKMFWIAFANMRCEKESIRKWYRTKWSLPKSVKTTLTLSNSKEFANTFGCPLGSKMNPVEKCSAW